IPSTYTPRRSPPPADAQELFRAYLVRMGPYDAAVAAAGDTPWHGGDVEARRETWFRRYQRPDPPEGLGIPDIRTMNREMTQKWLASGWTYPSTDVDQRPDAWFAPKPQPQESTAA